MIWTYLFIACIFEIIFALSLKYTQGFSRLVPSIVTVVAGTASVVILSQSVKALGPPMRCGPVSEQSARRSWACGSSTNHVTLSGSSASD